MNGPEGLTRPRPLEAAAYPSPENSTEHQPYYSPEGFNVNDEAEAEIYLRLVHVSDLPQAGGQLDAKTGYHLALALQKEKRAAIYEDGVQQNVAEHTANLAITTILTALNERPDLNSGKVAIFAVFHDIVEAYCGDTKIMNDKEMDDKPFKEAAAMTLMRRDFAGHPILEYLDEYEIAKSPEARYVKGKDKVEHYQLQLNNRATLHRERGEEFEVVARKALQNAAIDYTSYAEMKVVLTELGKKWTPWGCKEFEGDPEEVVENLANEVLEANPDLRATALPPLKPEVLRKMGVAVLADRRSESWTPLPPSPAGNAVYA